MLDVAVDEHPPEVQDIQDHMFNAVRTIATNDVDNIPDPDLDRSGLFIWLRKAEYKFCNSLIQQIRSMVKQGTKTANLRCLIALAEISETTKSDDYLLKSKFLKNQVKSFMERRKELQENKVWCQTNDNRNDHITDEPIVSAPSTGAVRKLFSDNPPASKTKTSLQPTANEKPPSDTIQDPNTNVHIHEDPIQVKFQGTDGHDYNISVKPNTPVKVRPAKKAKTSTLSPPKAYYDQDDDMDVISYNEPMVIEVEGDDGTEYTIPVASGTPVKMEKTRNIGKREKLFYLEKIISGLPNPLGSSQKALQSFVDSGVMTVPQYTTRSDAAHVMLMWRKNGHPEKKEGGFQLAITEVLMFYIVFIYHVIYICTQALNEILEVDLTPREMIEELKRRDESVLNYKDTIIAFYKGRIGLN